ncbi:Translin [Operophtera brumata]|uniref:Translin n=1 Tax=Operophtera brumata TaxID=104452 RepID=A0A0L7LMU3_OPEBR|nr:Translin [Operophtera brumata]
MSGNQLINNIFSGFQKSIDTEQELREVIRNTCREVDQISREITTVLQVIHHSEEGISAVELKEGFHLDIEDYLNDHLRKRFDALKYDVKKIEEVVYDLSIRGMLPRAEDEAVVPAAEAVDHIRQYHWFSGPYNTIPLVLRTI